jgi:hypothetical protein
MNLKNSMRIKVYLTLAALVLLGLGPGCSRQNGDPVGLSHAVALDQTAVVSLQAQTVAAVGSAPTRAMDGAGLAGVLGGVRVKFLKPGTHEVILPVPQLADTQIPVCYAIATTPKEAGKEYHFGRRDGSNLVVSVKLDARQDQEVSVEWSSVVLLSESPSSTKSAPVEPFLQATPCAQADAVPVKALADKLWPAGGKVDGFAANIRDFIRTMKQQKQPRSMDALGILESGGNWICTANANLAVALLRARNIPARSIAVVPPIGQRLEMHRIVDLFDGGQWQKFDPSFLQPEIPLKPWQNIIMARTTIADEELSMKPRMGSSLGCPFGQELEFVDRGLTLWGQDFFWTIAKPLARFQPGPEAVDLAKSAWLRFLESGKPSPGQVRAAAATSAAGLLEALKTE